MRSGPAVPRRSLTIPALIALTVLSVPANAAAVQVPDEHAAAPVVQFNRDIRPLLADRCFRCHGPDSAAREASLRLDRPPLTKETRSKFAQRISSKDPAERTANQQLRLQQALLAHPAPPETVAAWQRLQDAKQAESEWLAAKPQTLVMADLPQPRDTFVLLRGQYDQPRERVLPDVPAILPALHPDSHRNRLTLARRLAESGVRFIQLYHRGWDQHYNLPGDLRLQCQDIDQACAGLLRDLRQRGLLEDTVVFRGGEFGRTTYTQGRLERGNYGRDHHGRCFSVWLAGGGFRGGTVLGSSDDFGWSPAENAVHVHDLNATLLHSLGIDHTRLTCRFQGRDYRLTDVAGRVVGGLLS